MTLDQISVLFHASLGGLALLSGGVSIGAKKGSKLHKKSGKLFYYSMLLSSIVAIFITLLPSKRNPFLFSIGIFSLYFLLGGYRSLRFKNATIDLRIDKLIAYVMMLTSVLMVLIPVVFYSKINIILTVFALIGFIFSWRDLGLFKNPNQLKTKWLKLHLGKMTGAYIASVSAFFVVNQILPGIWNWFVPSIFGTIYTSFWMRKVNPKRKT
ncbi:MAG: DUF2306 domain-containing protein [Flavobacteriales bacterium]